MPGALVDAEERVALRTVEREDIEFCQRGYANPAVRYPLGNNSPWTREEVEQALVEGDGDHFLVTREADPDPGAPDDDVRRLGVVSVEDADWRRPALSYWLDAAVHGEGYGREAVALAVEYAFRAYDYPAVGAAAYDHNDASRGLLESLGFEQEGRRRGYRFVDGEYRDSVVYGLTREDWQADRD